MQNLQIYILFAILVLETKMENEQIYQDRQKQAAFTTINLKIL